MEEKYQRMRNSKMKTYIKIIIMYIGYKFEIYKNYILGTLGYQRMYDIDTGSDLTFIYYALNILSIMGFRNIFGFDSVRNRIGICKNTKEKYIRYILYNKRISETKEKPEITLMKYHDIIKIEIKQNKNNDHHPIDITEAKKNYYEAKKINDLNKTEREKMSDMINFYLLTKNVKANLPEEVIVTRKYFDDVLFKHTLTTEIINIM